MEAETVQRFGNKNNKVRSYFIHKDDKIVL